MARYCSRIPLAGLVLTGTLAVAGPSQALGVRCQKGQLIREVEVHFAPDADGLPCEVIWQTTAGSDRRELVWRSRSQLDFCADKGRELAHRLIEGGWTCASDIAAYASRSAPAETARLEPNEPEADAALPLAPEQRPTAPSERLMQEREPRPDQAVLQAALARDVERLDELTGAAPGSFEVQTSRLGNLDGDRIEDAVALLSYRSKGAPPSLHLLAYRFEGETFQPVARLPLTGTSNAQIREVLDGVIEVLVHVAQPGDPACCPSGRRHVRFVLRDHELVRLGPGQPGTWADVRRPAPAL